MLTGRRTKLAIAAAILIVGTGTAFLFRREDTADAPAAAKKPSAAERMAKSAKGAKSPALPTTEPALAGRIEPYGYGWNKTAAGQNNATLAERVDTKIHGDGSPPGSPAATAAAGPGTSAARERVAGYSSSAGSSPADSAARSQPYGMAPATSSPGGSDRRSTIFERFADHRPSSAAASDKRHKIVDGDTLASIARRHLGAEDRYLDLFEHNRDVLATPDLLPIGKELRIPPPDFVRPRNPPVEPGPSNLTAVAAPQPAVVRSGVAPAVPATMSAAATVNPPTQTYVVQAHDTLGLIARKVYGDINRQSELIAANRQQLRTPQDLRPGMRLVVPGGKKSE